MRFFSSGKKRLLATISKLKLRLNIVTAKIPKSVQVGDLLITTKAAVYHLQKEKCYKIGSGEYFGVTSNSLDRVWLFEAFTNLQVGRLIEFRKKDHESEWQACVVVKNLSRGIHQIYHYDGYVLLMDTYNNAIMKYCPKSCAITDTSYPFGRLHDGRESTNYMHMNSITRYKDGFLVMCHNETIKTGRNSEIAVLDEKFTFLHMIKTDAACAHDIHLHKQKMIYLDSFGGNIIHGDRKIVQNGRFLKGLAVFDETIIYGDNEHTVRGDRFSTFSEVVSVNTDTMAESARIETWGVIQQIAII